MEFLRRLLLRIFRRPMLGASDMTWTRPKRRQIASLCGIRSKNTVNVHVNRRPRTARSLSTQLALDRYMRVDVTDERGNVGSRANLYQVTHPCIFPGGGEFSSPSLRGDCTASVNLSRISTDWRLNSPDHIGTERSARSVHATRRPTLNALFPSDTCGSMKLVRRRKNDGGCGKVISKENRALLYALKHSQRDILESQDERYAENLRRFDAFFTHAYGAPEMTRSQVFHFHTVNLVPEPPVVVAVVGADGCGGALERY